MQQFRRFGVVLALVALLAACQNPNELAMKLGQAPASAVNLRALEARRFSTLDEPAVLAAATQTLQDLGYVISESSSDVGVLVGAKQRDAEETGQIVGQIALTVALAFAGVHHQPVWDKEQTINAMLVVTPIENSKQVEVRISFDRNILQNDNKRHAELIQDADIYQEFFDKLSQGVFLEAQKI